MFQFVFALFGIAIATSGLPAVPPAAAPLVATQVQAGLVAEDQTPSGRFLTATEIKPIMTATRNAWIAVREWEGQDLVYVTHLWSWRCGLAQIQIAVNGGPLQIWPLPPCHAELPQPNAILETDGLPYASFALHAVERLDVLIIYDDLTTDTASFNGDGLLLQ